MPARTRKPAAPPAGVRAAPPATHRHRPAVLDPIITMNAGGIIQSASDSIEQVFGWTPAELYGRNVKVLIPEPRRSALDRYLDRYRRSDGGKALERRRRFDALRKDGSVFQIELSMSRADLPAQTSPFFIGIVRDVSQDIEVTANDAAEHTRLQHLITEQTRALANAHLRLQLSDRLASLGTLAAGLGHDINSVLLPVRARLNALEHGGITPAALAHVTAVRRTITYLQHLSDGLHFLTVDPDGPGADSDSNAVTDLAHWWMQVGGLLRSAAPRRVRLLAAIPAGLPPVKIAPHWLTQAVLNLIVNAGEAIPPRHRRARIRVGARVADDGRTVTLSVSDNGRGMAQAIQRRAFDLFFTTKPRSLSTGLGLSLVRKIAVRVGGSVELRSEPRKGTTVSLVLSVAPPQVNPGGARATPAGSALLAVRSHRIMTLITQLLIGSGFDVRKSTRVGPGSSRLWVTEPTNAALRAAERRGKRDRSRATVLVGPPPKSTRSRWTALGAAVIDAPEDFTAVRDVLTKAIKQTSGREPTPETRP